MGDTDRNEDIATLESLLARLRLGVLNEAEEGLVDVAVLLHKAIHNREDPGFVFGAVLVGGNVTEATTISSEDAKPSDFFEVGGRLQLLSMRALAMGEHALREGDHAGHGCALDPTVRKNAGEDEDVAN